MTLYRQTKSKGNSEKKKKKKAPRSKTYTIHSEPLSASIHCCTKPLPEVTLRHLRLVTSRTNQLEPNINITYWRICCFHKNPFVLDVL